MFEAPALPHAAVAPLRRVADDGAVATLRCLANSENNPSAIYILGRSYAAGDLGLARSMEEAARLWRRAAALGSVDAMLALAVANERGDGVDVDFIQAAEYWRMAADRGDVRAQCQLGYSFETGSCVAAQDYGAAVRYFKLAADQGDADARHKFEALCAAGGGVARDDTEAFHPWERAAAEGFEPAMDALRGREVDEVVARAFYARLGERFEEAARLWQRAADLGHVDAFCMLGFAYALGHGVKIDTEKAVEYFRMAANRGNATAQFNLGCCFRYGDGVAQDDAEAVRFYKLAADQGYTSAEFNLGAMYADGRGVARDVAEASRWFERAAAKGHEKAMDWIVQHTVVSICEVVCARAAADRGSPEAKRMLPRL